MFKLFSIDHEINISTLSDDELSSKIEDLSKTLSSYQILLWDCFEERERRHAQKVNNLQAVINIVRDISNKGNIHENESVDKSLNQCQNTSTAVLTIFEINSVTKEKHKLSRRKTKPNIDIENDIALPSNASGDSTNLYRYHEHERIEEGEDYQGRLVYKGELVEILTGSKNGKPFTFKYKAVVKHSTGSCIKLGNFNDKSSIGFRDSKNIRLDN